jgi:hypothetical protein
MKSVERNWREKVGGVKERYICGRGLRPTVRPLCGRLQYQPPRSEVLVREMSVNTWDFYCSLVWRAVAATSTSVHSPPTSLTARVAARASPNLEIDGW